MSQEPGIIAKRWRIARGLAVWGRGFLCGAAFVGLWLGLVPAGTAETPVPPHPAPVPAMDGCGPNSPCRLPEGRYRVRMPSGWDGRSRVGAIIHLHGYRGTAARTIDHPGLVRVTSELGLALIAPQGAGRSWSFPGSPSRRRDDVAFIGAVLDDAVERHSIDPDRIMASGFSVGASMVWYLACHLGDRFIGFAPVAGAFWEPLPERCPGPEPNLIHVHGTSDAVVPMAGRAIGDVARQGDVRQGLALWFDKGGCAAEVPREIRPDGTEDGLDLVCDRRTHCAGRTIELCLHSGGHRFEAAWVKRAWLQLADAGGDALPPRAQ